MHACPGVDARIDGAAASTPRRTCTHARASMHESTARLHPRHGVRARMPGHRCTNRRRGCIYATAYVHACQGIDARMPGHRCTNRRRGCIYARACVHACPGIDARIDGFAACTPRRASPDAGPRRTSALASVHGCPACMQSRLAIVRNAGPRARPKRQEHPRRCVLSSKNRHARWQKRRFRVLPFKGRRCGRQPRKRRGR
jgi:hypothetical protein